MEQDAIQSKKSLFNDAILKHLEFFKCLYDEINQEYYDRDTYREEIYGNIISFMGRHDRWLNCRLVCKSWNKMVYNKYWIFTNHLTLQQAHNLNPGMFCIVTSLFVFYVPFCDNLYVIR